MMSVSSKCPDSKLRMPQQVHDQMATTAPKTKRKAIGRMRSILEDKATWQCHVGIQPEPVPELANASAGKMYPT